MLSNDTRSHSTGLITLCAVLLLGCMALPSFPALADSGNAGNVETHELEAAHTSTAEYLIRLADFLRHLERELADPGARAMAHAELEPLGEHLRSMASHTFHRPDAEPDIRRLDDHRRALLVRIEYLLATNASTLVAGAGESTGAIESQYRESAEMRSFYSRFERPDPAPTPSPGSHATGAEPTAEGAIANSISGHILDPDGNPASGVLLILRTPSGSSYYTDYTDSFGHYDFIGISPGIYHLHTEFSSWYQWLDMVYPDVVCPEDYFSCDLTQASELEISTTTVLEDIDMRLHRGATARGRVLWDEAGTPAANIDIHAYTELGSHLRSDRTDIAGRFAIRGLAGGNYHFEARSIEIRGEMWQDRPCSGPCQPLDGDPVAIVLDEDLDGLDFGVTRLGAIEGVITHASTGEHLDNVGIDIYDSEGASVSSFFGGGSFRVAGLETGTYYAVARSYDYVNQLFGGASCEGGCIVTEGTPIAVTEGETVRNIDFALAPYGEINGRVTSSESGEGIDARVRLFDAGGGWVDSAYVYGTAGRFEFLRLPPGQYRASIEYAIGFRTEAFDDLPCPAAGCYGTFGDLVTVESGAVTRNIDFALERLGAITGTVTDSNLGQPAWGVFVTAYDDAGDRVTSTVTGDDGTYELEPLPVGEYYVVTSDDLFADEAWQNLPCEGSTCDPTTGTPIAVAIAETVTGIDFDLARRPFIGGRVTELGSGVPLVGVWVTLYDNRGERLRGTYVHGDGSFRFEDLPAGTYYLHGRGGDPHIPMVWPDISCFAGLGNDCEVTDGDPIVIDALGATADLALPVGGTISGSVWSGEEVPDGYAEVYDSTGTYRGFDYIDSYGEYRILGLETGTYFVRTNLFSEHIDLVWDGILCESQDVPDCDPTTGTPIMVSRGADTPDIDFRVPERGSISGTIEDARTGAGISKGRVILYEPGGAIEHIVYGPDNGRFVIDDLLPGTYYLTTCDTPGYQDRVYGGAVCEPGPCDPIAGTPIVLGPSTQVSDIVIQLEAGPGVSIRLIGAGTGTPIEGAAIDLWRDSDAYVGTLVTDAEGRASAPLLAGTYYLSTDNGQGWIDELWNDVPCPEGSAWAGRCDPVDGMALSMVEGEEMTEMNIALDPPDAFFIDGFESGSTSRWAAVAGLVSPE